MKECTGCKQIKPFTDFYVRRASADKLSTRCKPCIKITQQNYRKKKFTEVMSRHYQWKANNREKFREYQRKYNKTEKNKINQVRYLSTIKGKANRLLGYAAHRASLKKIACSISAKWVQIKLINGFCELTGIAFDLEAIERNKRSPFSPSIDRIDCSQGYTEENSRLVCTIVNLALNVWGEDAFDKMAVAYVENKKSGFKPSIG